MDREGHRKYVAAEMCHTMNRHWGFGRHDCHYKSLAELIETLCACRRVGANYLLNIGPMPDGRVRIEEMERLNDIGKWMQVNEKAIRKSQRCELIGSSQPGVVDLNLQGPWTRQGKTGFWHLFRYPGTVATAVRVGTRPVKAKLLATGEELTVAYDEKYSKMTISGLPALPYDRHCTVIEVEFLSNYWTSKRVVFTVN